MTLFALADLHGVSHADARRIASTVSPYLRHAHRTQELARWQEQAIRKLFLARRPAPVAPMELPNIPRPEGEEEPVSETKPADGMTIKQIAELCEVSESSVRNWIDSAESADLSAKTAEARKTSVAARFTLPETLAIIRSGGKNTLADLLEVNAKSREDAKVAKPATPATLPKLPSGAQLKELRLLTEKGSLSRDDLRYLLGINPSHVMPQVVVIEQKAPRAIAEPAFRALEGIAKNGPAQGELALTGGPR